MVEIVAKIDYKWNPRSKDVSCMNYLTATNWQIQAEPDNQLLYSMSIISNASIQNANFCYNVDK